MITEKDYLKEPCSTMITPFYMARRTAIRKDMLIVADSKYNETLYRDYTDSIYKKVMNELITLKIQPLNDHFFIRNVTENDLGIAAKIINNCYKNEQFDEESIFKLWDAEYSYKDFWAFIYSKKDYVVNKETKEKIYNPIGIFIANMDPNISEASIEYLAIKEEYRNKGLGYALLKEMLLRIGCICQLVTCNYPLDNPYGIDHLFKKAGFEKSALWHVLKKKSTNEMNK